MSELITASEAAQLLNVSPDTVRRWAREGRIKVVVLPSGVYRYSQSEIKSFTVWRNNT